MSTESTDPRFENYQRDTDFQHRLDELNLFEQVTGVSLDKNLDREDYRIAVVAGRWHQYIVDPLVQGALDALNEYGIGDEQIDYIQAPGAFEFPLVVQSLLQEEAYSAVIVLGVVIKGETPHFEYVAGECAKGLAHVSLERDMPIGFGLLTVNTVDQALARAQSGESNKGREAVLAALEVADLQIMLDQDDEDDD